MPDVWVTIWCNESRLSPESAVCVTSAVCVASCGVPLEFASWKTTAVF